MAVKIVTDSTADMPLEEVRELGVTVVPLNVLFGNDSFRDQVDISSREFFSRLRTSRVLPKTSQPAAGAFLETYRSLLTEPDDTVLSLHISGKLSGTINSARTARDSLDDPSRVTLLDSATVSAALAYGVRAAVNAAKAGGDLARVRAAAENALGRTSLRVVLDTLEFLQRGGRIGRARALIGGVLNIKPLLRIAEGEVLPLERVRTRSRAIGRLVELTAEHKDAEEVTILHSGTDAELEAARARLAEAAPGLTVRTGWLGPVVGVYSGPDALGMVVLDREAGGG